MDVDETPALGTVTPDDFRRIREVFELALQCSVGERRTFVEQACQGNTLLLAEVERMLAAEDDHHRLLDGRLGGAAEIPLTAQPTICPSCRTRLQRASRFCPSCGTPVGAAIADEGRFRAGALFAGRFRIVAALGHGGMGEVYRAHDLELGQQVALKFLTLFRSDERARARLRTEVRLARQISHPNVCRVYDIGEAHGELYLSMEFVDGEDLAALLKRIGRLPVDKGVEIARKLCAGLAAAHAKGVLHRDLKPANIMIDSRGEVRIMDFGLAAVASELDASEIRSGTPAYMAPEQLAGREATAQSDLYALGLVLYEVFTGRPPFETKDLEELLRQRESHPSTTPSTIIPDLSPRVERAILKCLEPDAKLRPSSALEVSASLPGGDPLAEALAAGETPSPEMVAASGPTEALRPSVAFALLAAIGAGLAILCWLTPKVQMVGQLPLEQSPEVLAAKARELATSFGYVGRPSDVAFGFREQAGYVKYVGTNMSGSRAERRDRWRGLLSNPPSPVSFWYREADAQIVPNDPLGRVSSTDPPPTEAGTLTMDLGLDGRLLHLTALPTLVDRAPERADFVRWPDLFAAARLDISQFQTVESVVGQSVTRQSWTGSYPGPGQFPIRIEGSSTGGRVTSFEIVFPWTTTAVNSSTTSVSLVDFFNIGLLVIVMVVARRNWTNGRVDRAGAWRMAVVASTTALISSVLLAHHLDNSFRGVMFGVTSANGVFAAGFYLALEPWVRRLWPESMITWARVIAGRWRDPVVGRDVLLGVVAAVAASCLHRLMYVWLTNIGTAPAGIVPLGGGFGFVLDNLMGVRAATGGIPLSVLVALQNSLVEFFILFLCKVVLRKSWLAVAAALSISVATAVLSFTSVVSVVSRAASADYAFIVFLSVVMMTLAMRLGFLALTVWVIVGQFVEHAMLTPDFGAWYGQSSLIAVIVVSAMALWAFRVSLGSRRPFADVFSAT
jgi:serine/threonine-protein kinase